MFSLKYKPTHWLLQVYYKHGKMAEWGMDYSEMYGPYSTKEEAEIFYNMLKFEDDYGSVGRPIYHEMSLPPQLTIEQHFKAAKNLMRNPAVAEWRPFTGRGDGVESKESLEHRCNLSNQILEGLASKLANKTRKGMVYGKAQSYEDDFTQRFF